MKALRDRERGIHPHDAGVEVQLGHALEAAGGTFLDADAAAFAVVHQNLVQAVRSILPDDARLRADEVTVVARVARPAAETAVRFVDRLLLAERLDHFLLCPLAAR